MRPLFWRGEAAVSRIEIAAGLLGLAAVATAFAIDISGWTWRPLAGGLRRTARSPAGLRLWRRRIWRGVADVRVPDWRGADGSKAMRSSRRRSALVALVGLFLQTILIAAFRPAPSPARMSPRRALTARLVSNKVWGYGGVVMNTLELGLMTARHRRRRWRWPSR
jgi:hypothetical protein